MLFGNQQYHQPCGVPHFGYQPSIAPFIFYPLSLLVTVLFPILLVGLLILVDRTRFTPVVRARAVQPNYMLEQFISSAIRQYGELNLN